MSGSKTRGARARTHGGPSGAGRHRARREEPAEDTRVGPPGAQQALHLQTTVGNRAAQRVLSSPVMADRAAPGMVIQRSPPTDEMLAEAAKTPQGRGLLTRLGRRIRSSLAGRLLAAYLESRGARNEFDEGKWVRRPQRESIERQQRQSRPQSRRGETGGGSGSPTARPRTGSGVRGGLRVVNVVGVLTLADDIKNLRRNRVQVQLEGKSASDYDVGHTFERVYYGDTEGGTPVYVDVRVGRNIVRRKRFYIIRAYMEA